MTPRHGNGVSNLLRRLPPSLSGSSIRPFTTSRLLKEHDAEEIEYFRKGTSYDYRKPSYAARRNFPAHIRHLMRSVPNPLTVIISRLPASQSDDDDASAAAAEQHSTSDVENKKKEKEKKKDQRPEFAGLLVSSFNTVTLTPKPYVSFNIRLPSSTYFAIEASKEFTASGLKDAQVAHAFVKRKPTVGDLHGDNVWRGLADGDGRLKEGKGGTWWMRCRVLEEKCVEVGDHVVIVGKVVESGGYEGGEGIGLVYADGAYRKVGEVVDVGEERGKD